MVQGLYDFWLKELADYYIEAIKPVMKSNDAEA
jgi:valyl-tRNA synthetase